MARAPDSGEHSAMRQLAAERANALNRLIGCLAVIGGGIIAAVLLVGYWATH